MEKTRLSDQLGRGSHWGLKGRGLPPPPPLPPPLPAPPPLPQLLPAGLRPAQPEETQS